MRREARAALAVFLPVYDTSGNSNADGHEIRFISRNALGYDTEWSYTYVSSSKSIERRSIDLNTGAILSTAIFGGINAFAAHSRMASSINNSVFSNYKLKDYSVATGIVAANSGNAEIVVTAEGSGTKVEYALLSGVAESGFTVVQFLPYNPPGQPPRPPVNATSACRNSETEAGDPAYQTPPSPGAENDPSLVTQFRRVCSQLGPLATYYVQPCPLGGITPITGGRGQVKLPSNSSYVLQWSGDGGATWEYFGTVTTTTTQDDQQCNPDGGGEIGGTNTSTSTDYYNGQSS